MHLWKIHHSGVATSYGIYENMVIMLTDLSNIFSSSFVLFFFVWHHPGQVFVVKHWQPVFCKDRKATSDNTVKECLYGYSYIYTPSDSFLKTEKIDWSGGGRQVLHLERF